MPDKTLLDSLARKVNSEAFRWVGVRCKWLSLVGSCAASALLVSFIAPQDEALAGPRVEVEIPVEIQSDWTFDSDDADAELNDLFTKTEPFVAIYFTDQLSLQSQLVIEPLADPKPGDSRAFESHGIFAEILLLSYATDRFDIYGGKFNPNFAVGFDLSPGIYGEDFPEEYEVTERIGVGFSTTFGDSDSGIFTFRASTFFADTSALSGSLLESRGRLNESDGGPSNTEDLSSFVVSLDGEGVAALGGTSFHLAVRHQSAGSGDVGDEFGVVGALFTDVAVSNTLTWTPFVELAYIEDADGLPEDRFYWTIASSFLTGPWRADLAYSQRDTDFQSAVLSTTHGRAVQATIGYQVAENVLIAAGYKYGREDGLDSHTIGARLSFSYGRVFE